MNVADGFVVCREDVPLIGVEAQLKSVASRMKVTELGNE
jgi:hypothetical protein